MALLTGGAFVASAQSYYDDDIYYDASKDTKPKQVKPKKQQPVYEDYYYQNNYDPTLGGHNMPGSDAYKVSGTSTRSVDEYNRRGQYATNDTTRQSMSKDGFEYTRRIERFHNDDIVSTINDPELVDYYYSQPEVNIIINSPGYWGPSWAWNRWYSPWYWDPWDWGWGPSWGWDWGPSWGWGPGYYPPPHWGWGGGSHRPGRPVIWGGGHRPAVRPGPDYRPGQGSGRPTYSGGYRRNDNGTGVLINQDGGSVNRRPGSAIRPGSSGNRYDPAATKRPTTTNGNNSSGQARPTDDRSYRRQVNPPQAQPRRETPTRNETPRRSEPTYSAPVRGSSGGGSYGGGGSVGGGGYRRR
ncbi:hypothetical protein [uncultured Muribaculum sp.]|uniref:hypothetical protein n=1 Tax=uncultured Muribaculum sp. TaxID=1918613 RepID=UPI00272CEAC4|nr:hypothetical protein [uncultured Muribaculum sp.]